MDRQCADAFILVVAQKDAPPELLHGQLPVVERERFDVPLRAPVRIGADVAVLPVDDTLDRGEIPLFVDGADELIEREFSFAPCHDVDLRHPPQRLFGAEAEVLAADDGHGLRVRLLDPADRVDGLVAGVRLRRDPDDGLVHASAVADRVFEFVVVEVEHRGLDSLSGEVILEIDDAVGEHVLGFDRRDVPLPRGGAPGLTNTTFMRTPSLLQD